MLKACEKVLGATIAADFKKKKKNNRKSPGHVEIPATVETSLGLYVKK